MSELLQQFQFSLIDQNMLFMLIERLLIDIIFLYIIIEHIYYRYNKKYKFILSYYLVNLLIFFISSLLTSANIQTGFAFGLFAVFSIIRYRTDSIRVKDMTYLFICIILAVFNSLVTAHTSIYIILFANLVILLSSLVLEKRWIIASLDSLTITVEDIKLVPQESNDKLITELIKRTGLKIVSIEITNIDYVRDTFTVKAFYKGSNPFD